MTSRSRSLGGGPGTPWYRAAHDPKIAAASRPSTEPNSSSTTKCGPNAKVTSSVSGLVYRLAGSAPRACIHDRGATGARPAVLPGAVTEGSAGVAEPDYA